MTMTTVGRSVVPDAADASGPGAAGSGAAGGGSGRGGIGHPVRGLGRTHGGSVTPRRLTVPARPHLWHDAPSPARRHAMFERLFGNREQDTAVADRIPPGQYRT